MGTVTAMLVPYFRSCEGCEYGNIPIDLPFQSRNNNGFHLLLLPLPFALGNRFTLYVYICTLIVKLVLVVIVNNCFRKKVFLISFGFFLRVAHPRATYVKNKECVKNLKSA